jgi:EpsI family protein
MNRRDLVLGGAMLAAAGGAVALQPRQRLVLIGDARLEDIVPTQVADWTYLPSSDFILPKSPGSLSDRLYNQTVSRLYVSPTKLPMIMVIAYGAVQNDLLQLHRPESCYAAVGFAITESRPHLITLAHDADLPVRQLTAISRQREEQISYWTRIGDDLPTDARAQRQVKLAQQMRGVLADGILVRISAVAGNFPEVFDQLSLFSRALVEATDPAYRQVLIGRPLAAAMAGGAGRQYSDNQGGDSGRNENQMNASVPTPTAMAAR